MTIVNILPQNKIEGGMIRQEVELYLSFVILKDKEKYKVLKNGKTLDGKKPYIILDNGAADLQYTNGIAQSINTLIEASDYIDASEIVLPDALFSDDSLNMSLEALNQIPKTFKRNIAACPHATSYEKYIENMEIFVKNPRINTIMIGRDLYMPGNEKSIYKEAGLNARLFTTERLIEMFKKYNTIKQIHWLGGICMQEYIQIPKEVKKYIRSSDTGMYIAELSQLGKYDLGKERPKDLIVNLEVGNFDWKDVKKLIREQSALINGC